MDYTNEAGDSLIQFDAIPKSYSYLDAKYTLDTDNNEIPVNHKRIFSTPEVVPINNQIFREHVSFKIPNFKKRYEFLSFRIVNNQPDALWIYSPLVKDVRQISGSNRSDTVLNTAYALDDFLGWSIDPSIVKEIGVHEQNSVMPYNYSKLDEAFGACHSFKINKKETSVIALLKAKLVKYYLLSNDPHNRYGRQVVYFDAQSKLPVYNFIYDNEDQPYKLIFNQISYPVVTDTHVFTTDKYTKVHYQSFDFCKKPRLKYVDFDPSKIFP